MKITNLHTIYESNNSTIYKGKHSGFDNEIIIKVLNQEYPTEEQITRFNNEYEFIKDTEISGVRKVFRKEKTDGKNVLLCEYFEGQTLKKFINTKSNFNTLINIASNISQILGEVHLQNIIHKDINANNILINNDNELRIIDFGLATKYTLKTQNISNPEHLEGTISYISPEQTGRMNRSVDYRTDLYSYGIVLYEMFTQQLPFSETDSMVLIHSHIAKSPTPPNEINKDIPKILSEIILKLLSKNAEDRYQSAFGLKHDLQLCQSSKLWQNFTLGEKDFSGKLSIPEKLYGRENEIEKLYKIYENVSQGQTELLLISGYSGVGKSALIHEIHKPLTENRAFYIEGKFDQFQKNIPFRAIILAFTDFANAILKESEENLKYWRNLIQESVGNIGGVLSALIPDLELIIGKQPNLPELEGEQAQNRFNYVWSSFVKAISAAKHPLVVFIDDIQWADNASLELLKILLSDTEIHYLFCIIAYRDNEINSSDLQGFISLENVNISEIKLENLTQNDITNLFEDVLKNSHEVQKLTDLVYSKTSGNAFFTTQFLINLYEEELLKFDFENNCWTWNIKAIQQIEITDNVVEFLAKKIKKQPKETQEILKIAACIGNRFNLKTLSIIYKSDEKHVKQELEIAIYESLIFPIDKRNFEFVHDRIQQAIYSTIPDDEKNIFHLQVGKLLLKSLDNESLQKQIFDVVNQLNFGIDLLENQDLKQLTRLNLQAAIKAKASSAYLPAYDYLKISSGLLENNTWKTDYDLTLQIYDELAELSYLTGNYKETELYVKTTNKNTKKNIDGVNANCSLIHTYRAQSQYTEAVKTGLKILSKLGLNFPKNPSKLHIIFNLIKSSLAFQRIGLNKFKKLPLANDILKKAQFKILQTITSSVYISSEKLLPLIIFKNITSITNNGFYSSSPYLIAAYGFILGTINKFELAEKIGEIAPYIQEKHNLEQGVSRTNFVNINFIKVWNTELYVIVNKLIKSHKIDLEIGDIEFASYHLFSSDYLSFNLNINLTKLKEKAIEDLKQQYKFDQNMPINVHRILLQTIHNLLDRNYDKAHIYVGEYFEEDKEITEFVKNIDKTILARFYQTKALLLYIFNVVDEMEAVIENISKYEEGDIGSYFYSLANFYSSLCSLAIYSTKNKKQRKVLLKTVSKNQKQMKIWAKHCPENFQSKFDLVEGEKCRVLGKKELAQDFYSKAIKGANRNKFICEEAIAWETAARFYLQQDNKKLAKIYLQDAYKTYKTWGAIAKLRQLEDKYTEFSLNQNLFQASHSNKKDSISSTIFNASSSSNLDISSLVKASNSLSGEVKLEKLLKSMLMLVMENAGAEYAVIIEKEENKYTIQAKGKYNSSEIEVLKSEDIEKTDSLALNIVKYVIRTRKFIVLDNAITNKGYLDNEYIQKHKVKSVFCYPVIHKKRLVAILYLENNLSTNVFTSQRIETINILSSQIAVSLENAQLYENMETKVISRTAQLQQAKDEIEYAHKHITDSINYAKRIQDAILPTGELFEKYFADFFVLFKPRDIVSGDFYWTKKANNYLIFAAADCTGHGVPGAFLSMLGISFLNEIARMEEIKTSAQMLEELRFRVKISLHQTGNKTESKDGMDIALCVINTKTNVLQYAGAYNPLYIIRNNKLIETKATRSPIGIFIKEKPFVNNEIQLQENDIIYIFSDGFIDQFGEENGRKFTSKKFKALLLSNAYKPMPEQQQILDREFENWRGNVKQIDDVLVVGVKV